MWRCETVYIVYTGGLETGHRMLPFVLVLLFIQNAYSAPSVAVSQVSINDVVPASNPGRLVSSYLTDRAFEIVDGGDTNIYILTIEQILNDLANMPDKNSQAMAMAQTIAVLGELATGMPGDSCAYASMIDAEANYLRTGNSASLASAMAAVSSRMQTNIDLITNLANSPSSQRYSAGPVAGCVGGGRSYQFEAAWDLVLDGSTSSQIGLINEEYCAAKRLYNAFNVRSNNVGAAVTAASLPSVVSAMQSALVPAANFLNAVASGGNPSASAAQAKSAMARAFSS